MSEFDIKATDWDQSDVHLERARTIAGQLKEMIPLRPGMKAMEFGAGTALLSFLLRDLFSSVTLVDNSMEMIKMCNKKIAETQSAHFQALQIDLETEQLDAKYDLIYSQMTFHHLSDVDKMIHTLHRLLNEGGILAIADLYSEDGSFHGEEFTGHKGFDPDWLSNILHLAGFGNVTYKTCYIQKKTDPDGKQKEYPLFLMIAK